jgi:hypothetical protein
LIQLGFDMRNGETGLIVVKMKPKTIIVPVTLATLVAVSTAACAQDTTTSSTPDTQPTSTSPTTSSGPSTSATPSASPTKGSATSTSFSDGSYKVGATLTAGPYMMAAAQSKPCTLTISPARTDIDFESNNADISLDNTATGQLYTVNSGRGKFTLRNGDKVKSNGCGIWNRV